MFPRLPITLIKEFTAIKSPPSRYVKVHLFASTFISENMINDPLVSLHGEQVLSDVIVLFLLTGVAILECLALLSERKIYTMNSSV